MAGSAAIAASADRGEQGEAPPHPAAPHPVAPHPAAQHPGAPGQCGGAGLDARVRATLRATPLAMLVISASEYVSWVTGTGGLPSEYPAAYMTRYGPAVKLPEICRL